jgi:hypothetical protein
MDDRKCKTWKWLLGSTAAAGICSALLAFGLFGVATKKVTALADNAYAADEAYDGFTVTWLYTNNGTREYFPTDHTVAYNGFDYVPAIDEESLPAGVEVKEYGGVTSAKDLDTDQGYTTTVVLTTDDSNGENDSVFTLCWKIKQGKYDLSDVTWNYSAPFVYNGEDYTVALQNVPEGLVAHYENVTACDANTYRASVSFTNENSNYLLPDKDKESSYTGNFSWNLKWTIKPVNIALTWKMEEMTDRNGFTYNLPVISDANSDKVSYTYYKSDEDGSKLNEVIKSAIRVREVKVYYLVQAAVKSDQAQNYKLLGDEDMYWFSIEVGPTSSGNVNSDPITDPNATIEEGSVSDGSVLDGNVLDGAIADSEPIQNNALDGDYVPITVADNDTGGVFVLFPVIAVILGSLVLAGATVAVMKINSVNKKR